MQSSGRAGSRIHAPGRSSSHQQLGSANFHDVAACLRLNNARLYHDQKCYQKTGAASCAPGQGCRQHFAKSLNGMILMPVCRQIIIICTEPSLGDLHRLLRLLLPLLRWSLRQDNRRIHSSPDGPGLPDTPMKVIESEGRPKGDWEVVTWIPDFADGFSGSRFL